MARVNTTLTYVLRNNLTNSDYQLGIVSNGTAAIMDSVRNLGENNQWFMTVTNTTTFYRLHTVMKGRPFALDVKNRTRLYMTETTDQNPGQYWRFDKWKDGNGYRLSNNLTGLDMLLDVLPDSLEPYLAPPDHPGQHWRLWSAITKPKTENSSSSGGGNDGLSNGAIAGIVVGIVVLACLALLGVWWILRRRRRRNDLTKTQSPKASHWGARVGFGMDPSPVHGSGITGWTWGSTGSTAPQELDGQDDAVSPLSNHIHPTSETGTKRWEERPRGPIYELPSPVAELTDEHITRKHVR